jgi:predicted RNA binding protein with dsRBD fold (UPF0201 family)
MEPSFRITLQLEARIAPSESPTSVQQAIENVMGDSVHKIARNGDSIRAVSSDPNCLQKVHDQLRDRHVRAAARRLLLSNRSGDKVSVMLNRQAAFHGVIALCGSAEESPLGPIHLTIASRELDSVLDWLTAYPSG